MLHTTRTLLAAGAAIATLATPVAASAQYYDRYYDRRYDRDNDIDAEDIIGGIAIIGGLAAIMSALDRDRSRYGYGYERYRGYYENAVRTCAYQAQRYARGGRVRVLDVDRRDRDRYRVRGVVESGYGGYGGYGGGYYDRGYDDRGYYGGGYDRGYYGGGGYGMRFACTAYGNGRIVDFDVNRY